MADILTDFEPLFKKYIDDFDMAPIMVYLPDVVNVNAFPYLAEQFNVDGVRGFNLATTETAKRELLKNGINTRKKLGTNFAIKQALKSIGYENVDIVDKVGYRHDGTKNYDGEIQYNSGRWIDFGVNIYVPDISLISTDEVDKITLLINEYKRATSFMLYLNILNS